MKKEKLRTERNKKGYTQQQIANILATDVSNYSRKENGDVKIISQEWEKIAQFLNVSVEEIYEEDTIINPVDLPAQVVVKQESVYITTINNLNSYIKLLQAEIERLNQKKN
ncbi:helix-turn-helix domain-containing protein [Chryseobacterium aurantiacum]|uniref:helix-turn-helix domain-containing protein n=1 Tax=Chryseobacterium aurantiacum TaxID=2116499 RepID=UPI000D128046|nr:helix-turn-helix transcriptional regulator [Chryseobacterium aurantiacum]